MTRRLQVTPAMLATAIVLGASVVAAVAQSTPNAENGRYTFTPTVDGVLRLDTRNGRIASCHNRITGWACYTVPDERAALDTEIGRLQTENTQLKNQLADMRGEQQRFAEELARLKQAQDQAKASLEADRVKSAAVAEAPAKAEPKQDQARQDQAKGGKTTIELQLPDEKQVERVVSIVERAWRNLIAMADRVQKDVSGKI